MCKTRKFLVSKMINFAAKKHDQLGIALSLLCVGVLLHYFSKGILRNHGVDLCWLLFGIQLFRVIWGDYKKSLFPISAAILWEISELFIVNRVFDPIDLCLYLVAMVLAVWYARNPGYAIQEKQSL